MLRARSALAVAVVSVLTGCAYGATRPPTEVGFTAATLQGTVGATEHPFDGTWWFEYRNEFGAGVHETAHVPFSVEAEAQEPVSARVTGLDALGDALPRGGTRVRSFLHRACVEGDSPAYGPLCSRERRLLTGDAVLGSFAVFDGGTGILGEVTAESGVSGEAPAGRLTLDVVFGAGQDVIGPITCLAVSGAFAAMAVDNEVGTDALVRLYELAPSGTLRVEILDPPADPAECPDPEAVGTGMSASDSVDFWDGP